jgi:hypothetical protein
MRLGLVDRPLSLEEVLETRLFPGRIALPQRLMRYYRRLTPTRRILRPSLHQLNYAF